MAKLRLPQVGDVIVSKRFAYGYREKEGSPINVGIDAPGNHVVHYPLSVEKQVALAAKTGQIPPKEVVIDHGVTDLSRGEAKFVVTRAVSQGGGPVSGGGGEEVPYPDGWHITAKRLTKDGKFNPKGESIVFYMTGCFIDMIPPEDIKIVGHLKPSFT
jgi:hypothetical protein